MDDDVQNPISMVDLNMENFTPWDKRDIVFNIQQYQAMRT